MMASQTEFTCDFSEAASLPIPGTLDFRVRIDRSLGCSPIFVQVCILCTFLLRPCSSVLPFRCWTKGLGRLKSAVLLSRDQAGAPSEVFIGGRLRKSRARHSRLVGVPQSPGHEGGHLGGGAVCGGALGAGALFSVCFDFLVALLLSCPWIESCHRRHWAGPCPVIQ